MAGTIGFLLSLLANLVTAFQAAMYAASPAIRARSQSAPPRAFHVGFPRCHNLGVQRSLAASVPRPARSTPSIAVVLALIVNIAAVATALVGSWVTATGLFVVAASLSATSLNIFDLPVRPPKVQGVHATFPAFVAWRTGGC